MFKNLLLYRLGPAWSAPIDQIEDCLAKGSFVPCSATQARSSGWVPPRGTPHGALVEPVGPHLLLKMMTEQKVLPGSVVKRRTEELAQQAEQASGRKPGKKQMKELKEQAELELLPMAFTKQSSLRVWIDTEARLLMIDAGSPAKAEEVVTALVKAFEGFVVGELHTEMSPSGAMSDWLASGEPPAGFTVDRDCELKSADELKSVVRYARHPLDIEEVRQHIGQGKLPTKLALTWDSRVSFVLTDTLQVRKIAFLDVVFEGVQTGSSDKDEAFDADAAIATGELSRLIPDLIDALGGEKALPLVA